MYVQDSGIASQTGGSPRLYQLSPPPTRDWIACFPRAVHQSRPARPRGVKMRLVSESDIEVTGITFENSIDADQAVHQAVERANHLTLLNAVNQIS